MKNVALIALMIVIAFAAFLTGYIIGEETERRDWIDKP